eukprot:Phypoly_transcript_03559.p1 GENE.Phypoly_transcript_03559~~Phypoly_transcript_03559.p1  ORF type:complete len:574 (+),score=104.59 Phypoly_transcript_03559:204-1724(+)
MKKHNEESEHPVALSFSDLSIWCYSCEDYVSQATGNIVYHAHMIKHKCPPGMAEVSKEEMEQIQNIVFGFDEDSIAKQIAELENSEKSEKYGKKQSETGHKRTHDETEPNTTTSTTTTTTTTSTNTTTSTATSSEGQTTNSQTTNNPATIPGFVGVEGLDPACYQNKVIDRILGCIYGNALGDAVGLATEFMTKAEIKKAYGNAPINYPKFKKNYHNCRWEEGDWTDDTDQMILILETLLETKTADPILYANKLLNWIRYGFPDLGDNGGMGLGATTSRVVQHKSFLQDPIYASADVWEKSGRTFAPNGGVMRTSVVGCYHFSNPEEIIKNSDIFCKVTHADPRCIASCRSVVVAIAELLNEAQRLVNLHPAKTDEQMLEVIMGRVHEVTRGLLESTEEHIRDFEFYLNAPNLDALKLDESQKIGYTFKAMGSGFWGLRSKSSFSETMELLAKEGGDADTNGAVCGALMGCRIGYNALPHEWLAALPNKKWLDKKVVQFLRLSDLI